MLTLVCMMSASGVQVFTALPLQPSALVEALASSQSFLVFFTSPGAEGIDSER